MTESDLVKKLLISQNLLFSSGCGFSECVGKIYKSLIKVSDLKKYRDAKKFEVIHRAFEVCINSVDQDLFRKIVADIPLKQGEVSLFPRCRMVYSPEALESLYAKTVEFFDGCVPLKREYVDQSLYERDSTIFLPEGEFLKVNPGFCFHFSKFEYTHDEDSISLDVEVAVSDGIERFYS